MDKKGLIDIFESNLHIIEVFGYDTAAGFVDIDDNEIEQHSKFYHNAIELKHSGSKNYDTKIYVQDIDSFDKAEEFGMNCAVLNMASFARSGGGVRTGSRAQEECLCRRSNLIVGLSKFDPQNYEDGCWLDVSDDGQYPMKKYDGIWCPEVSVFRRSGDYHLLNEPWKTNVISVAGIKKAKEDRGKSFTDSEKEIMINKIKSILNIAIDNNVENLVLGALSCGAYGCRPEEVSILFKNVLESKDYKGMFKEICFAIIEDKNSPSGGNIKPFSDVFGRK